MWQVSLVCPTRDLATCVLVLHTHTHCCSKTSKTQIVLGSAFCLASNRYPLAWALEHPSMAGGRATSAVATSPRQLSLPSSPCCSRTTRAYAKEKGKAALQMHRGKDKQHKPIGQHLTWCFTAMAARCAELLPNHHFGFAAVRFRGCKWLFELLESLENCDPPNVWGFSCRSLQISWRCWIPLSYVGNPVFFFEKVEIVFCWPWVA